MNRGYAVREIAHWDCPGSPAGIADPLLTWKRSGSMFFNRSRSWEIPSLMVLPITTKSSSSIFMIAAKPGVSGSLPSQVLPHAPSGVGQDVVARGTWRERPCSPARSCRARSKQLAWPQAPFPENELLHLPDSGIAHAEVANSQRVRGTAFWSDSPCTRR